MKRFIVLRREVIVHIAAETDHIWGPWGQHWTRWACTVKVCGVLQAKAKNYFGFKAKACRHWNKSAIVPNITQKLHNNTSVLCSGVFTRGDLTLRLAPPFFGGGKHVLIFNVKKIMLIFEHFENVHLKCTPCGHPFFIFLNTPLVLCEARRTNSNTLFN